MKRAREASQLTNVLVVGVGGQGILLISKVLAQVCQQQGLQVKQSEVHGMAKRGGVVFSHVRFGTKVWSPTIPVGEADILLALEWAEGLRWLSFLHPEHGTLIADLKQMPPPFAYRERRRGALPAYNPESVATLSQRLPHTIAIDATGMAKALGNERVANTILLGSLATSLPFPQAEWVEVLRHFVPAYTVELNCQAFLQGWTWGSAPPAPGMPSSNGAARATAGVVPAETLGDVTLEINEAWCKGCDICVKMCPERCLVLNGRHVAELVAPQACTGCRICEMLCPDLAIRVRL